MNYPHPILAREGWPFIAGALVIACWRLMPVFGLCLFG